MACRALTCSALLACCAQLLGCGGDGAAGGVILSAGCPSPAEGAESTSNIIAPGDRYDFETIPAGTDPRLNPRFLELWNFLVIKEGLQCWVQERSTTSFQFFEDPAFGPGPRYRFVGMIDIEAGAFLVQSAGCYYTPNGAAFTAAVVSTWTGELELLGVAGDAAFDHFTGFQGDFPLISRYVARADLCL